MMKKDMKNRPCMKCSKGLYVERSVHDDWEGVLHCDKCGHKINRYPKIVEVYQDPETDEYTVSCEGFDDFSTFSEQEAMDEATVMAEEIGGVIHKA